MHALFARRPLPEYALIHSGGPLGVPWGGPWGVPLWFPWRDPLRGPLRVSPGVSSGVDVPWSSRHRLFFQGRGGHRGSRPGCPGKAWKI